MDKQITFTVADAAEVKTREHETAQEVSVLNGMRQHCSRCKRIVVGEPLSLGLVDVVDEQKRHEAQFAVAAAMYDAWRGDEHQAAKSWDSQSWDVQSRWLRAAAADSWRIETFEIDAIGLGLDPAVREAGKKEAVKWPAYSDRRKVFRVTSVKFPPGWISMTFEARGMRDGQPVPNARVGVHICPECAPKIFDAAGVDPQDPFGNGVRW